jgi:hypothetical protein
MKNLFKVLGIIALVAIIGFSFAACKGKDSGGGIRGVTFKDEIDISVNDSKLIGTWKGDDAHGTLIITANKIGTTDKAFSRDEEDTTVAAVAVWGLKFMLSMFTNAGLKTQLKLESGKLYALIGDTSEDLGVPYTVSGNTLEFYSFIGTKQ